MVFLLYSSRNIEYALGTLSSFKFGFYMKIPPRDMFVAQVMKEKDQLENHASFIRFIVATFVYTVVLECIFLFTCLVSSSYSLPIFCK
jgi:hypothetical protein